jgi:hypothetical protein
MAEQRFAVTQRATSARDLARVIDDFTREGRGRIEQIRVSPWLSNELRRQGAIRYHGGTRIDTFMGVEVVVTYEMGNREDVILITERPPRQGTHAADRVRAQYDALRAEPNDALDAMRYATIMGVWADEGVTVPVPPPQTPARRRTFGDIVDEWMGPGLEAVFNQRRTRAAPDTNQVHQQQCNEAWAEELTKLYEQDAKTQEKPEPVAPAKPERKPMNPYPEQDTGPFNKTIVHLKRRGGWKQTKTYPGNGPLADTRAQLAMPERGRAPTTRMLEAGPIVAPEAITTLTFHLVKSAVITDHRTGERVRETWYEED